MKSFSQSSLEFIKWKQLHLSIKYELMSVIYFHLSKFWTFWELHNLKKNAQCKKALEWHFICDSSIMGVFYVDLHKVGRSSPESFSEKWTKMTYQLHILEFEMPSFSNKIHKNRDFLFLMGLVKHFHQNLEN